MTRAVLALSLLALSLPAFADSFDGSGGALPQVKLKFQSGAKSASSAERAAAQSGADLYYFTPEEAAQAAQRFAVQEKKEKGFKYDSDVPAEIQAQMNADLAFMRSIEGSGATPLHQKIFGPVSGKSYHEFFDSRVTGIGMSGCGSANAVACVSPMRGPSKMWLTQNFVKFSHPQVSRMMVVYHEARHTEIRHGFWSHATCPSPFKDEQGNDMKSIWTGAMLAGEPACDKTPLGSYGSSTIMLKNIQKFCANCGDKVKMDAGLYADDQMGRITAPDAREQMKKDLYQ